MSKKNFRFSKSNIDPNRILGIVEGSEKAPTVIIFAGIHGNEKAGVKASKLVLHKIKEDGFSLHYQFINHTDKICSTVLTSHVCLDSNTHKRRNLPKLVLSVLRYNE